MYIIKGVIVIKKTIFISIVFAASVSSFVVFGANVNKTPIYNIQDIFESVSKDYAGDITKIDLETKSNKSVYYEVDILNGDKKTELIVDATTGKVLKSFDESLDVDDKYLVGNYNQNKAVEDKYNSKQTKLPTNPKPKAPVVAPTQNTDKTITLQRAEQIALDKVGGGKIVRTKVDLDDSITKYEIEILFGEYEYEIDIDAKTGTIIDYDSDHIYD